jgi:hypothetical protein
VAKQTLLEYLSPVLSGSRRAVCLAALKWLKEEEDKEAATASEIKDWLVRSRVPKAKVFNVADVLGKSGHLVTTSRQNVSNANLWSLTTSGEAWVDKQLGIEPTPIVVVNSVSGLSTVLAKVTDPVAKSYVDEALLCFRAGALRATVVFLWSGAVRTLQDRALGKGSAALTAAVQKHDPKAKSIAKIEDYSALKDATQLLAFRDLGLIDKGEWQTLQEGLDLRNRCGHPTKYKPGVNKVAALIEDIVGIAF